MRTHKQRTKNEDVTTAQPVSLFQRQETLSSTAVHPAVSKDGPNRTDRRIQLSQQLSQTNGGCYFGRCSIYPTEAAAARQSSPNMPSLVQRSNQPPSPGLEAAQPIQRLRSRDDFQAAAGDPTADTFWGYKKKSKRYKALLAKLGTYTALANALTVSADGMKLMQQSERLTTALQAVLTACDGFITRYENSTRRGDATEKGRLDEVRSLKQESQQEMQILNKFPGGRKYAGMKWKDALPQFSIDSQVQELSDDIKSIADDDGKTIEQVRDKILNMESMEVKQLLLNDNELWAFIGERLNKTDALILASVLLNRALEWYQGSGPDFKNRHNITRGGDFSKWILSGDENDESKPNTLTGSMNCWEGVLFSMYKARLVPYSLLKELHNSATRDAQAASQAASARFEQDGDYARKMIVDARYARRGGEQRERSEQFFEQQIQNDPQKLHNYKVNAAERYAGANAYYKRLADNLGSDSNAQEWHLGDPPPPAGNVVFFVGNETHLKGLEKYKISHVCLSLGKRSDRGTELMNFGPTHKGKTIWGETTIEDFIRAGDSANGIKPGKYHDHKVKYAPSSLLDGVLKPSAQDAER